MNLSNEIKITKVKAASTAATSAVTSDAVDMQGYEGVLFFTTIGTANAGNYLKVQQDSASNMATAADLAGKKIVAEANGQVVWLDIYKPTERYLHAVVTRTASSAAGDIYAVQYNGRIKPEGNNVDDVIIGELLISPDEEAVT